MSNLSGDPVPLSGKISKFSADQEPEIRTVAELLAKHPEKRSECVKNLHRNVEVSQIFNIRKFQWLNVDINFYIFFKGFDTEGLLQPFPGPFSDKQFPVRYPRFLAGDFYSPA
jgi:hypothetical protein